MSWTTPNDLREQVLRAWERGKILSASITGETLFPLRLSMRRPEAKAVGQSFEAVREWIHELEENSRSCNGFGYENRMGRHQPSPVGAKQNAQAGVGSDRIRRATAYRQGKGRAAAQRAG